MTTERWLPVVGYEGLYEVSSMGRVKNTKRAPFLLSLSKDKDGYPRCTLFIGPKRKFRPVHALVLEAFVGPRPLNYQACHHDGVKANSALENLRWDTMSANQLDRIRHIGPIPKEKRLVMSGEGHHKSKLSTQDVWRIREALLFGAVGKDLAKVYDVYPSLINKIKHRQIWTNI